MMDLVSVIIPTKNEEKRLGVLLPSLIKQTYKNIEVIINDDNDTNDNTVGVIRKFGKKIKIRHIRNNQSMAHGRKAGAKVAKGKYLLQLDADMKLTSKVIEACVKAMNKGYSACVIPEISEGKGYWAEVKAFEKSLYIGDETMSSARFFKKIVYNKLGGHNVDMVLSEDKDLHLRAKKAGYQIFHIKELLYHYEWAGIRRDLQKKFYYGRTAHVFMSKHPDHSAKQANLIFRTAYFRNWKKLILNPHLTFGMFALKILETAAAAFGFLSIRLGITSVDPWKK